jgi:hypothetical protein
MRRLRTRARGKFFGNVIALLSEIEQSLANEWTGFTVG